MGHVRVPRPVQRLLEHHAAPDPVGSTAPCGRPVHLQGVLPADVRGLSRDGLPPGPSVFLASRGHPGGGLFHRLPDLLHRHAVPQPPRDGASIRGCGLLGDDESVVGEAPSTNPARGRRGRCGDLPLLVQLCVLHHSRRGLGGTNDPRSGLAAGLDPDESPRHGRGALVNCHAHCQCRLSGRDPRPHRSVGWIGNQDSERRGR